MKRQSLLVVCLFFLCTALGLAQTTGTITGKVENEDGKDLAGVKVIARAHQTGIEKEAVTDKDGKYRFTLEAGAYTLLFEAEGYPSVTLQQPVVATADKATSVRDVRLRQSLAYSLIRGKVYTEEGQSLPGATLVLERLDPNVKKMRIERAGNSSGEFSFRLPAEPGRYRITVSLKGYKSETREVEVDKGEARSIALRLIKQ